MASSAERNWSEFGFNWNSLGAAKATALVRVHSNLRLRGKRTRSDFDGTNAELRACEEEEEEDFDDEEGVSA